MRDKKKVEEPSRHRKVHLKRRILVIVLFAAAAYYYGIMLDEEKRGRVRKLMFEGREMWFRLFV